MFTGWTMDASPKDLLYGELATTGARLSGNNAWETLADNRNL